MASYEVTYAANQRCYGTQTIEADSVEAAIEKAKSDWKACNIPEMEESDCIDLTDAVILFIEDANSNVVCEYVELEDMEDIESEDSELED